MARIARFSPPLWCSSFRLFTCRVWAAFRHERQPSQRDWDRFTTYCALVRTLFIEVRSQKLRIAALYSPTTSGVLHTLEMNQSLHPSPLRLLPFLRELHLSFAGEYSLRYASVLLSDSIRILILKSNGDVETPCLPSFLSLLPIKAPLLVEIGLSGDYFSKVPLARQEVTRVLRLLPHLTCVGLQYETDVRVAHEAVQDTLFPVALMNNVRELHLWSFTSVPSESLLFGYIQVLTIFGPPLKVTDTLQHLMMPVLRKLVCTLTLPFLDNTVSVLNAVIARQFPCMQELRLYLTDTSERHGAYDGILLEEIERAHCYPNDFAPLCVIHSLVDLSIETEYDDNTARLLEINMDFDLCLCWSDHDIFLFATNLHLLRHLDLTHPQFKTTSPSITLAGLLPLAEHCQLLRTLKMSVNGTELSCLPPISFPPRPALRELFLGHNTILKTEESATDYHGLTHLFIIGLWLNAQLRMYSEAPAYLQDFCRSHEHYRRTTCTSKEGPTKCWEAIGTFSLVK